MKLRLPKTRRYRVYIYLLCTLIIVVAFDLVWIRVWRHISIGLDTTVITAPLNAQGMPDYIRYLDERAREGVTVENNTLIPLLGVMGDGFFSPSTANESYRMLGVPAPRPGGPTAIAYDAFYSAKHPPEEGDDSYNKRLDDEEQWVTKHPWSAAEHPEVANWLKAMEQPLARFHEAAARTRYYWPLVAPHDRTLIAALLPALGKLSLFKSAAIVRAMLLAQQGQFAAAREDLLAVHRIARLVAQNPTLVDYMIGLRFDTLALQAEATLCGIPGVPADELRQLRSDLQALTPFPSLERVFEMERFNCLDAVIFAAQHPADGAREFVDNSEEEPSPFAWMARFIPGNYNGALRDINRHFDSLTDALEAPKFEQRKAAFEKIDQATEAYRQRYGALYQDPAKRIACRLVHSFNQVPSYRDSNIMQQELVQLTLALAFYHLDHKIYPDALGSLSPGYLATIPSDLFVDSPLRYTKTADGQGFLLYSVGPNQQDDGGNPRGTIMLPSHPADDLAVRVPLEFRLMRRF